MTGKELKRVLKSNPNFISNMFVRSCFEAQQLALASTLTMEQIVQELKQSADIPESIWEQVDAIHKLKEREGN